MHFARSIVLGYHSIPKINWGSFRGRREEKWGSFRGQFGDHFGVDLGIILGSGSSRGMYRSCPSVLSSHDHLLRGPRKLFFIVSTAIQRSVGQDVPY